MNNFIASLRRQMPEGADLPDEHVIQMATSAGEVTFIIPEREPETVICRAAVGPIADIPDPDTFLRDALAGNRFWSATGGATLSLGTDETLYLTARYEDWQFADETMIGTVLASFTDVLATWRRMLEFVRGGVK